ncbi:hypothetical protein P6S80_003602 [Klebsiella pneumoniae]
MPKTVINMDKFDRDIQRETLQLLYAAYPNELTSVQMDEIERLYPDMDNLIANLLYLHQHQLISSGLKASTEGYVLVNRPEITHRGIDFIRDDGGLGAILNVQTVKLHDSTIIALEDIIRVANIPEEQRKGLISKLRELPADAIKHLTLQLLTPAVLHPQAVIQSIEKFLQTM